MFMPSTLATSGVPPEPAGTPPTRHSFGGDELNARTCGHRHLARGNGRSDRDARGVVIWAFRRCCRSRFVAGAWRASPGLVAAAGLESFAGGVVSDPDTACPASTPLLPGRSQVRVGTLPGVEAACPVIMWKLRQAIHRTRWSRSGSPRVPRAVGATHKPRSGESKAGLRGKWSSMVLGSNNLSADEDKNAETPGAHACCPQGAFSSHRRTYKVAIRSLIRIQYSFEAFCGTYQFIIR